MTAHSARSFSAKRVNNTFSHEEFIALKSIRSQSGAGNSRVTTFVHELVMDRLSSELRNATPEKLSKIKSDLIASGLSIEKATEFLGSFANAEKTQKSQENKPSDRSHVHGKAISSGQTVQSNLLPIPRPALKSSPVLINRKPSTVHPLGYPANALSKSHQMFIGAAFAMGNQNQDGLEGLQNREEDDTSACGSSMRHTLTRPSSLLSSSSLNTINLKSLTRPRAPARVDIDIDSEKSDESSADGSHEKVTDVTDHQPEPEDVTKSAISRRSHRADHTVAPCAARASRKQADLIPIQLTPRAQECLDEMRRLGGPFEVMEPEVQERCAAEADKLLRSSKDLVCTVKAYYAWWTTASTTKRHRDTRKGWIRWVTTADSGIYDRPVYSNDNPPKTWQQREIERKRTAAERRTIASKIRERERCQWVNSERRRLGEPTLPNYDDMYPDVAGLRLEDYED